jgi:hypothetical protein
MARRQSIPAPAAVRAARMASAAFGDQAVASIMTSARSVSRTRLVATESTSIVTAPRGGRSRTSANPGHTSRNQVVTAGRAGDDVQANVVTATATHEASSTSAHGARAPRERRGRRTMRTGSWRTCASTAVRFMSRGGSVKGSPPPEARRSWPKRCGERPDTRGTPQGHARCASGSPPA